MDCIDLLQHVETSELASKLRWGVGLAGECWLVTSRPPATRLAGKRNINNTIKPINRYLTVTHQSAPLLTHVVKACSTPVFFRKRRIKCTHKYQENYARPSHLRRSLCSEPTALHNLPTLSYTAASNILFIYCSVFSVTLKGCTTSPNSLLYAIFAWLWQVKYKKENKRKNKICQASTLPAPLATHRHTPDHHKRNKLIK